jgi:MYXO-CTERM domain-containing protein
MILGRASIAACAAALLAIVPATGASAATVGGIAYAEPGSVVNGRSIGNMGAEWWKFVLELPRPVNPAAGGPYTPGPLADEGISFLYGLFPGGPPVGTLEATVQRGHDLLLPLRNWVNIKTEPEETAADLFEQLEPDVATVRNLRLEVNGVDFEAATGRDLIAEFRERFPVLPGEVPFGVTLPPTDSVLLDGLVSDLFVVDGHWMLLRDIPLGNHSILVSFDVLGEDGSLERQVAVTHQVAAVPGPAPLVLMLSGLVALAAARRRTRSAAG